MARPEQAAIIDGSYYIEDKIPGYMTVVTSGRESLSAEVESEEKKRKDGAVVKSYRYPSRTITVQYQLKGRSRKDVLSKLQELNALLRTKEHKWSFNDDAAYYYIGVPINGSTEWQNRITLKGEYQVFCADPFKYSWSEKYLQSAETDYGRKFETLIGDIKFKTWPIFRLRFADANGQTGWIHIEKEEANGESHSVTFGSGDNSVESSVVLDKDFTVDGYSGFNVNNSQAYRLTKTGAAQITDYGLTGKTYGTASTHHGPLVVYNLPNAMNGDFCIRYTRNMEITDTAQRGALSFVLYDQNDTAIFEYMNTKTSTSDMSSKREYYKNGTAVKKLVTNTMSISDAPVTISREDNVIYIQDEYSEDRRAFVYDEASPIAKIAFYFGQNSNSNLLTVNAVKKIKIIDGESKITDSFPNGSILVIDTKEKRITLDGERRDDLGHLTNEWEYMNLLPDEDYAGRESFVVTWSRWNQEDPSVSIRYREALL